MALGVIGGIASALGSIADYGYNIYNNERQWKSQEAARLFNQDMATKNYQLQLDNFNYNKWLNQEQMNREDTAVQRKAADLEAAGMNRLLATGGASAQAGHATSVGNTQSQIQGSSLQQVEGLNMIMDKALNAMTQTAQIKRLNSETALMNAQAITEASRNFNVQADTTLKGYQSKESESRFNKFVQELSDLEYNRKISEGRADSPNQLRTTDPSNSVYGSTQRFVGDSFNALKGIFDIFPDWTQEGKLDDWINQFYDFLSGKIKDFTQNYGRNYKGGHQGDNPK